MTRRIDPRAVALLFDSYWLMRAGLLPCETGEEGVGRLVESLLASEPAPDLGTVEAAQELLGQFMELCPDLPERIRNDLEAVASLLELAWLIADEPQG